MKQLGTTKARPRELVRFTHNLAQMLEVGFPPLQMMRILQGQSASQSLAQATARIADTIENGGSLSEGMRVSPKTFDQLYINLVRSGEISGRLPAALRRITAHLERSIKIRRDVTSAMIYPLCVISTAAAVSSLLLIFIIPAFKELFADLDAPLPWLTRMVVAASETSLKWLPILLVCISSFCFIVSRYIATRRGREIAHTLALKIPVWGELTKNTALARSCRTLATTLNAGIPIMSALEVSAQAAGNTVIQQEFLRVRSDIAEGSTISHSLDASKLFPSIIIEMLEIGERLGTLDTILENIAVHFEDEVERLIIVLKQLVEPVLILILGALIGTLVVAMYLPIFTMGELFA